MLQYSPLIQQLIDAFRRLPGVGGKSAQRMVLHLLGEGRVLGQVAACLALAFQRFEVVVMSIGGPLHRAG